MAIYNQSIAPDRSAVLSMERQLCDPGYSRRDHHVCQRITGQSASHVCKTVSRTHNLQPHTGPSWQIRLISPFQRGFRAKFSCETKLLTTLNDLFTIRARAHRSTWLYILDFGKAFSKVPRNRLMDKLIDYSIEGPVYTWIRPLSYAESHCPRKLFYHFTCVFWHPPKKQSWDPYCFSWLLTTSHLFWALPLDAAYSSMACLM